MKNEETITNNEDERSADAADVNKKGEKPFHSFKQGNKQQNLTHEVPQDEQMHEKDPEPPNA